MSEATVYHAAHEGVQVLRYVGEIRYPLAPSIRQFVDRVYDAGDVAAFAVDLSQAVTIDSTELGVLAQLAQREQARGGPPVTLIGPNEEVNEVLRSMAFDEVFRILPGPPALTGEEHPVPEVTADRHTLSQVVLQAHQQLMELNEDNRARFTDVVELLKRGTS